MKVLGTNNITEDLFLIECYKYKSYKLGEYNELFNKYGWKDFISEEKITINFREFYHWLKNNHPSKLLGLFVGLSKLGKYENQE